MGRWRLVGGEEGGEGDSMRSISWIALDALASASPQSQIVECTSITDNIAHYLLLWYDFPYSNLRYSNRVIG